MRRLQQNEFRLQLGRAFSSVGLQWPLTARHVTACNRQPGLKTLLLAVSRPVSHAPIVSLRLIQDPKGKYGRRLVTGLSSYPPCLKKRILLAVGGNTVPAAVLVRPIQDIRFHSPLFQHGGPKHRQCSDSAAMQHIVSVAASDSRGVHPAAPYESRFSKYV